MTSIYRFDRLEHFEQAVRDKDLTFVSPYEWPDQREGKLFRATFSRSEMADVKDIVNRMLSNTHPGEDFGTAMVHPLARVEEDPPCSVLEQMPGESHSMERQRRQDRGGQGRHCHARSR